MIWSGVKTMDRKRYLHKSHILPFIVMASLGPKVLTLPRDVSCYAGNDSWLSVILGGTAVLILTWMIYWIMMNYPELNLSQIFEASFGRFFGKLTMVLFGLFNVFALGMSLRIFADNISLYLLDKTPDTVIKGLLVLLCIYALLKGIGTITTTLNILFPATLIFLFILLLLPWNKAESGNLLPVLHEGILPVVKGSHHVINALSTFFFIGYITPYIRDLKGGGLWGAAAIGLLIFIYLWIVLMCILVFGAAETTRLLYPTITLSKSIQLRAQLFERAESLMMTVWIVNTFAVTLIASFVAVENMKALFGTEKKRMMIYVQMTAVYLLAHIPRSIAVQQRIFRYVDIATLGVVMLIPAIAGITLLKKRKKSKSSPE